MESSFDTDDYNYQTLNTPPFHVSGVTGKSFDFPSESKFDLSNDLLKQPGASEITTLDCGTSDQPNNTRRFSLGIDLEDLLDEKSSFDLFPLSRSESCPEPTNWPALDATINADSSDLEELIIQDITSRRSRTPKLHEFLRLLLDNENYSSYASWLDKTDGLFKIHKPNQVANLWRRIKTRKSSASLDYDTFARSIRYYYKPGIMRKTHTRHTYRFAQV